MKKFVSLFLSIILVLSLSVLSFADWDSAEYDWSVARDIVIQSFPGEYSIRQIPEVNASLWLPLSFTLSELSDDDVQSGCIANFMTGPEDAFVMLYYTDSDGVSLDALLNSMLQNGNQVKKVSVNGIPAVMQKDLDTGLLLLFFQTVENKFFEIVFFPAYADALYDLVIASIQPVAEEDTSEPVAPVSVNPVSSLIYK